MKKRIKLAFLLYTIGLFISVAQLASGYLGAKENSINTAQITQKLP